ncbi:MAG: nucleotidyltransferase family protein [Chloroflexi bacterium]|nr:nucleotidyltransferase family protein [Chloroflexota bacterium]
MKNTAEDRLQEIEKILKQQKPLLEKTYNVKELAIFGSYLRGKQKEGSDLDLLVGFSEPISLFDFIRLEDYLTEMLGVKVDLVMSDALKPRIKDKVLKEALYV